MRPVPAAPRSRVRSADGMVNYCDTCNGIYPPELVLCPICEPRFRSLSPAVVWGKAFGKKARKPTGNHRRKRLKVYARDGHACVACGSTSRLTLDHIVPVSKGGTNRLANLQTLCGPCNNDKGDLSMDEWTARRSVASNQIRSHGGAEEREAGE